jgi:hypothetical protein
MAPNDRDKRGKLIDLALYARRRKTPAPAAHPVPSSSLVYQLQITLRAIEPPIWRRFQVPADTRLDRLHLMIQWVMGWTNSHLHEFVLDGRRYGTGVREWQEVGADDVLNERRFTLAEVAPAARRQIEYTYDFGDGWQHDILVETIIPASPGQHYPVCLDGARACPPEDCGSYPGYVEFLEAMADPRHPRHQDMVEWIGGRFDPEAFSAEAVSRDLLRFGRRRRR